VVIAAAHGTRVGEPAPRRRFGLATRFAVAAAALVLVIMLTSVSIVVVRADRIATRAIHEDLARAPSIFESYRADIESRLRTQVRSLAGEPGTKALFDPGVSERTRWDFAHDAADILGARTVFLFDRGSGVLARTDRPEGEGIGRPFGGVRWVADPLETWQESSAVIREGDSLAFIAAAPVITGAEAAARLDGVIAASFSLDAATASAVQVLTRGDVAFLADMARRGDPPAVVVSRATAGFPSDDFTEAFLALPGAADELFGRGQPVGPFEIRLAGVTRLGVAQPIKSAAGEPYGAVIVLRSLDEEMAAFREIASTLLAVGGLALLVAAPLAIGLGRRIAHPLRQLAAGAAAIREGELEVALPRSGADEVGSLARAFRDLVGELKEKRALEQLVNQLTRHPAAAATLPVGPDPLQAVHEGEVFAARYRIRQVLGRGAMAVVFLARDQELDDDVAVKVLTPAAFNEGTQALQTIRQEIRLARRITHPNVVRVHDLGESGGVRFLTMEYVAGLTLRQVVDQQGPVALGPGLQIAKQLCRGLAAVHESGIVHRDIKPQNIMVLPGGTVKLMDFGIARVHAPDEKPTGEVAGTPYYMSPEQAKGGRLDSRSDIYSVGATLYELFTARRPFEGSLGEVLRKHLTDPPPPPSTFRVDLPETLERLILACLDKDPARRPAAAQDLYAALLRITVPDLGAD